MERPPRDDPVRPEDPYGGVRDVHRSSPPRADAAGPPHHFHEEPLQVDPLGQHVAVAAVVGADRVRPSKGGHHPGRHRLLPDAQVDEARNFPIREEPGELQLGAPDQEHRLVQGKQPLLRHVRLRSWSPILGRAPA